VIDGAMSGFALCSTGSNNVLESNVVSNSIGGGSAGSGSLISGCGPQGSSTGNLVQNNDQWQNPGGFGNCAASMPGMSCPGNISANPLYADGASHDYEILPTSPILSWSLWNGS
jgi:hypothetical protein